MSMQIKISEDFNSTTHYDGTVTKDSYEYKFVAIVTYRSKPEYESIRIEWVDEPEDSHQAIGRITKMVEDIFIP